MLRYEVWTLPWSGTFERVIADVPTVLGRSSGNLRFSDFGNGRLAVPSDYDRLDEIISDTVGTLVRTLDGTTITHEYLAERVTHSLDDFGTATVIGADLISAFDRAVVYPRDYTTNPSNDPDWIFGGVSTIQNGGLEDEPYGVANYGFESGLRAPWFPGAVEGVSANASVQSGTVDTGTYALSITPLLAEGGASTTFRVHPSRTYTVTARFNGASGIDYQLGCSGPDTITATSPATVAVASEGAYYGPGHTHEAQRQFSASGSWETVTLTFTTGPDQEQTQLTLREGEVVLDGSTVYLDHVSISGFGIGTDPWEPTSTSGVTTFEADNTQASEGSWSLKITATSGNGAFQTLSGITPGTTYTTSVAVGYADVAGTWALEVRDLQGNVIAQDSATIATNAFSTLTSTFTTPSFIPGGDQLTVGVINYSGATRTAYADALTYFQGQAAATIGTILTQLLDDATTDHAADTRGTILDWVDYTSFSTTLDSSGASWDDSEVHMRIHRGMKYGQVLDTIRSLGYEWRLTPKASPGATTHDLEVYNRGGMGTDHTTADTPSLIAGHGITGGRVVNRIPSRTAVLAEGAGGIYVEDSDTTAITNFGRFEKYHGDRKLNSSTVVGLAATRELDSEVEVRVSIELTTVAGSTHPRPLVDFVVADELNVLIPNLVAKTGKRVASIAYQNTEPPTYRIQLVEPPVVGDSAT